MEENKKSNVTAIVVVILLLLIIGLTVFVVIKINKDKNQTTANNTVVNTTKENEITNNTQTNTNTNKVSSLTMTEEEFPKVDGATAMLPMVGEITKKVLGYTDEQAQEYLDKNTQGKSAKVYASLIDKSKDLIFVSEPSDDILQQAKDAGVGFDNTGIGYDGFVFLLNKENPVQSLTLDQIRGIYKGQITNWKEVGGDDAPIFPYTREANSGSENLMEKMVMNGEKTVSKSPDMQISSMSGLIDAISNGENSKYSIGYSIYLYAKEQYVKDNTKFLKINNIEPTDATITDKSYPLTKVVYAVTRKDVPQDSNVKKLINWLLTDEGQEVVFAGGYVKMK